MQPRPVYKFGSFALDPARRRLERDGQHVPVPSKAFDILVVLVENRGGVVDKDELLRLVWPGVVVEEGNLSQHVFTLRKILGETSSLPQFIATVPRRGYQFVATVRERLRPSTEDSRVARPVPTSSVNLHRSDSPAQAPKSLAVLPFAALSRDLADEYLGFGMADALIVRLGRVRDAVVRPTSAVRRYLNAPPDPAAAGRELGVDLVLQGAVQRSGERIRVTVQLVSVREQAALWGDHFDEPLTDIFTVQGLIADRLAVALLPNITADERRRIVRHGAVNVDAHLACLRGRYALNRLTYDGVGKALEQFEQAIALDPACGLAYAGLMTCCTMASAGGHAPPHQAISAAKALASALNALEFDENLAEAHAAVAEVTFRWNFDWQEAENRFRRAIQLDAESPIAQHSYAMFLSSMGRATEALDMIKRALELERHSYTINAAFGLVLYFARRYDEAIEQYGRALDLDPDASDAHFGLGMAYLQRSMYDEGVREMQRAHDLPGRCPRVLAGLAYAFALVKRTEEAKHAFAELLELQERGDVQPVLLAYPCIGLGDYNRAFDWLDKGFRERSSLLVSLKVEPLFDPLRRDARFAHLMRRMQLVD